MAFENAPSQWLDPLGLEKEGPVWRGASFYINAIRERVKALLGDSLLVEITLVIGEIGATSWIPGADVAMDSMDAIAAGKSLYDLYNDDGDEDDIENVENLAYIGIGTLIPQVAGRGVKRIRKVLEKHNPELLKRLDDVIDDTREWIFVSLGIKNPPVLPGKPRKKDIAWIVPGSLPAEEEARVLKTLDYIDRNVQPSSPKKIRERWGERYLNHNGLLPGPVFSRGTKKQSIWREFYVGNSSGGTSRGRIVKNMASGEIYYSPTHYGDDGAPAFFRIR